MDGNEYVAKFETTAQQCRKAIQDCSRSLILFEGGWAQNRLIGFNLWAAGLGVFAQGHNNLKKKLEHAEELMIAIALLVDSLLASTQRCLQLAEIIDGKAELAESDDPQQSLESSRHDVEVLLRNLIDIGLLVRQAGKASRLLKADMSFSREEYAKLEEQLEVTLQAEADFNVEDSTSNILGAILGSLMRPEQRHLITANLRRRHRFAWAHRRYMNLQDTTPTEKAQATVEHAQGSLAKGDDTAPTISIQRPRYNDSASLPKSASTVDAQKLQSILPRPKLPGAGRTQKSTPSLHLTTVTSNLTYPTPPAVVFTEGLEQFLCPCCWQALPIQIGRDPKKWKAHLVDDLQPYTCPHADCSTPNDLFASKKALVDHLKEQHRQISCWCCPFCQDEPEYHTTAALESHMRTHHLNVIRDEDVASTVKLCSTTKIALPPQCPVCNADAAAFDPVGQNEAYMDHLCQHIHDFSLRSLPWNDRNMDDYRINAKQNLPETAEWIAPPQCPSVAQWFMSSEYWLRDYNPKRNEEIVESPNTPPASGEQISINPATPGLRPQPDLESRLEHLSDYFDVDTLSSPSTLSTSSIVRIEDRDYFDDREESQELDIKDVTTGAFVSLVETAMNAFPSPKFDTAREGARAQLSQNLAELYERLTHGFVTAQWDRVKAMRQLARENGPLETFISACKKNMASEQQGSLIDTFNALVLLALNGQDAGEYNKLLLIMQFLLALPEFKESKSEGRAQRVRGYVEMYYVGWIAALVHERAVATALLDERHEPPEDFVKDRHDENIYTWGCMGAHNVVIASPPVGEYGTNIAAVAKSMLSSLPSIRIGLMVGIGAGIPNIENGYDIRLGDVVVGVPEGKSSGVVQYDLMKAKEGPLRLTSVPDLAPRALRSALASLRAQHEIELSIIPQLLEDMLKHYPQMRKSTKSKPGYLYPGFENDVYHFGPGVDDVQKRNPRDSTDPQIHYGTIASGNMLVKDAAERNAILERLEGSENVICLEMEAADLMDNFPCLVIKGICDYADQHKNDKWQRYAAATAAAFVKELLSHVDASEVAKEASLGDVMQKVSSRHGVFPVKLSL